MSIPIWHDKSLRVIQIESPDGAFEAYMANAAERGQPAIVVLHEVFGINADMRATCDELAAAGFTAICPELFWRQERHVDLSVSAEADWEKGLALYSAFDIDTGVRDTEATIAAARALPESSGRVGVLGFCLGGLLAFLTAARTRVDAAVAYHGARTEEFLAEIADIDAPLQMHLAADDEFISPEAQHRITAALSTNPNCEVFSYPGCRHAFSRHGGTHYDRNAALQSRARTLEFFSRHLG